MLYLVVHLLHSYVLLLTLKPTKSTSGHGAASYIQTHPQLSALY